MPTPRRLILLPALLLALAVAGCSDDESPSEPSPTPTPPARTTETFSGSFTQNGASSHQFTVSQAGDVDLKLTAMAPLATLAVGLGIGRVDAAATPPCTNFAEDTNVRVNETLVSTSLAAGTYCVKVRDTGNVFPGVTVTYTVDVRHP